MSESNEALRGWKWFLFCDLLTCSPGICGLLGSASWGSILVMISAVWLMADWWRIGYPASYNTAWVYVLLNCLLLFQELVTFFYTFFIFFKSTLQLNSYCSNTVVTNNTSKLIIGYPPLTTNVKVEQNLKCKDLEM